MNSSFHTGSAFFRAVRVFLRGPQIHTATTRGGVQGQVRVQAQVNIREQVQSLGTSKGIEHELFLALEADDAIRTLRGQSPRFDD
jgi:hypothetical protein